MIAVLDASAATSLVLERAETAGIEKQLTQADRIIVPELYVCEMANVLWKYALFQQVSPDLCRAALERALSLPDEIIPGSGLAKDVFDLSITHQKPAYDLFYVVLAKQVDGILVTRDRDLERLAKKLGVRI